MQKKLFFILSLTLILRWVKSLPLDLGSLEYDNLETDLSNLKYESSGRDLNDFFKSTNENVANDRSDKNKSKVKTDISGFRNKNSDSTGLNLKYNIEDLKKFLKQVGLHDVGSYDDGAIYGIVKGLAAKGVDVTGNEERKYKKGTKSKGFHNISHKDEYNRNNEFYEEDETSGVIKKVGAKGLGFETRAGAGLKKGYFHHDLDKGLFGKQGASDKGTLNKELEKFADSQGFDAYFKSSDK